MGLRRRILDLLTAALIACVLFAAVWYLPEGPPEEIAGPAYVIDGDSVEILGVPVRLAGLDAPEAGQTCTRGGKPWACGAEAASALRGLIGGRGLVCKASRYDRYRRALGRCMAGGTDVNKWLVAEGWAVSTGSHRAEERAARAAGKGVWAGPFEHPADWRKKHGI